MPSFAEGSKKADVSLHCSPTEYYGVVEEQDSGRAQGAPVRDVRCDDGEAEEGVQPEDMRPPRCSTAPDMMNQQLKGRG